MNVETLRRARDTVTILAGALFLPACSVNLVDRTGPNLSHNPPVNLQRFEAELSKRGNVTINGVTVELESGPSAPLTGSGLNSAGEGLWQTDVAVAACEQLVAYRFVVDYKAGSTKSETFPEEGAYVQSISGTDPLCDGIVSASKIFDVNRFDDLPDAQPGDGVCNTSSTPTSPDSETLPGGGEIPCSLRAAVMEANAREGVDLIRVPNGRYTLTRVKPGAPEQDDTPEDAWGDLDITDSVAIVGAASNGIHIGHFMQTQESIGTSFMVPVTNEIDLAGSDNVFAKVDGGEIDRVFDVHVGANGEDGFAFFNKLAILNGLAYDRPGGGILNQGRLRLERVAVYDNHLGAGANAPAGVFSMNRGVGIANYGTLVGYELAIVNNKIGGTGFAGGLYVESGAQTKIDNSLIALNKARFNAAVFVNGGDDGDPGSLSLTNVTVAENDNDGSPDYAINNHGELTLNFVSVISNDQGGLASASGSNTLIKNSLLANNGTEADCNGAAKSSGGNLIKDSNCTFTSSLLNPDDINFSGSVSADSLSREGGFTFVVRIRPPFEGTTTIVDPTDRISAAIPEPDTDQRGGAFARAVDADGDGEAQMDPGAFEYVP